MEGLNELASQVNFYYLESKVISGHVAVDATSGVIVSSAPEFKKFVNRKYSELLSWGDRAFCGFKVKVIK